METTSFVCNTRAVHLSIGIMCMCSVMAALWQQVPGDHGSRCQVNLCFKALCLIVDRPGVHHCLQQAPALSCSSAGKGIVSIGHMLPKVVNSKYVMHV